MAKEKFRDLEVGGRIKEVREQILGWSREQLGEALRDRPSLTGKAYTYDAIRRWEEDGRMPDAAIIREVAQLGNVSTDYILGMPQAATRPYCRELLADLKALVHKYDEVELDSAQELNKPSRVLIGMIQHGSAAQRNREATSGRSQDTHGQAETKPEKGTPKPTKKG